MTMPTTVKELWRQGWVAETEDEAIAQAERMYDLFRGKRVAVDRLSYTWHDAYDEWMFKEPWPEVWVVGLTTQSGWDGDVLYPEWQVEPADRNQVVTTLEGETVRMGDIDDLLFTTAPGVGTAEGFSHKDELVFPIQDDS